MGVIFKSENKSEEMLDILKQIRGYSPNLEDADQTLQKSIPIVGDQLTVERGVNVIEAVQNSYTPEEKLEGIHMEIADWHTAVTFLNVRECIISKHLTCTFKKIYSHPIKSSLPIQTIFSRFHVYMVNFNAITV